MKIKSRLERLEKSHSTNGQFKYTEADWTPSDWEELLSGESPAAQEKFRLTQWPDRKLEDYFI
ncbi:MAG: hypothetical protein VR69_00210 [Peptococcaceae bacterium BRH_c4b]|nr:MAG: hypothetical protein VR69_00210 [Peptococcaceae bacterium BRH_c4b]